MQLQHLAEAKYHANSEENFLKSYFNKTDEEDWGDGSVGEWWTPKENYIVSTEVEDLATGNAVVVSHIIVGVNSEGRENSIFIHGWDEALHDHTLKHLKVFKQVQ